MFFTIDKVEKLKNLINKYSNNKINKKIINTTDLIIKKKIEYVPLDDGTLIKVIEIENKEEIPSPVVYNPNNPLKKSISYTIPKSIYKKNNLLNKNPGPGQYNYIPKNSKILHTLIKENSSREKTPPLSGEISHEEWIKQPEIKIPSNRFPMRNFHPESFSTQFLSKTDREIFNNNNNNNNIPGPTDYNYQLNIIASKEKLDESSFVFKSQSERFPEKKNLFPDPGSYNINNFNKINSKIIKPPNDVVSRKMEELRSYDTLPDPGEYNPPIINEIKNKKPTSNFKSNTIRNPNPNFQTPSPDSYDISRNISKKSIKISSKFNQINKEWDNIPQKFNPSPTDYNINFEKKKGGYISSLGHNDFIEKKLDHPLGFKTIHSSLLKPTYNSYYMNSLNNLI